MKKIDRNRPIGKLEKVEDFLPPPEKLVIPERTIKVTLRLSESSIIFFKTMQRNIIQNIRRW